MLGHHPPPMNGRAEYKVDGGKLLRADVAVDGAITSVALHGDFFVYPGEAVHDIEDAVTGQPADADMETLTDRIADALDPATRLVGFAPGDVARVVTEAVDDAR